MQTPGLPWWLKWERICIQCRRPGFNPWIGKILWRKTQQSTPVFLAGQSHGQSGPGGLQSMGLQRAGQNWVTNTHMSTHLTLFKIEQHKSLYQASFRHSWARKLLKTASLFSKKRHAIETQQGWVLLWTKIEMNPPPFLHFALWSSIQDSNPSFSANATLWVSSLSSLGKGIKTLFSPLANISMNSFATCIVKVVLLTEYHFSCKHQKLIGQLEQEIFVEKIFGQVGWRTS